MKLYLFLMKGILLAVLFSAAPAHAFDDTTTHPALTQEIIKFYNLLHPQDQITPQQGEWIIRGSREEDRAPRWINHFYDPVHKLGWTGEKAGNIPPLVMRIFTALALSSHPPVSAVNWINSYQAQESYSAYGGNYTWKRGLEYAASGDEKNEYLALGHALHLLEDMGVPDHTRGDTHAHLELFGDTGSPLEDYAQQYTPQTIGVLEIPRALWEKRAVPVMKNSIEEYLASMAAYSNKYFFSKDTINDQRFNSPTIIREDKTFGYGLDENGSEFPLTGIDPAFVSEKSQQKYVIKDRKEYYPILDAYFSRLAPQIILNGVGAVALFKEQAGDKIVNEDFYSHLPDYAAAKAASHIAPPALSLFGLLADANSAVQAMGTAISRLAVSSTPPQTTLPSPLVFLDEQKNPPFQGGGGSAFLGAASLIPEPSSIITATATSLLASSTSPISTSVITPILPEPTSTPEFLITPPTNIRTFFFTPLTQVQIRWDNSSTNPGMPGDPINYEINISTSTQLDENGWKPNGLYLGTSTRVVFGDSYLFGVRARGDSGNVSEVVTSTWNFPLDFALPAAQLNHDVQVSLTVAGGAQRFMIPAGATISRVHMWLGPDGGDNTTHLELYADEHNSPGALVASSAPVRLELSDPPHEVEYVLTDPVILGPNTPYWLFPKEGPKGTHAAAMVYGSDSRRDAYPDGYWSEHSGQDAYFRLE